MIWFFLAVMIISHFQNLVKGAEEVNVPNILVVSFKPSGHVSEFNDESTPMLNDLSQNGIIFDELFDFPTRDPSAPILLPSEELFNKYGNFVSVKLKSVGYTTIGIGRWPLNYEPHNIPARFGFEEYFDVVDQPGEAVESYSVRLLETELSSSYEVLTDTLWKREEHNETRIIDEYIQSAISLLQKQSLKNRPFFLHLSLHHPSRLESTTRFALSLVDRKVASLVHHLKRTDQWHNTLLLFRSPVSKDPISLTVSAFIGGGFVENVLLTAGVAPFRYASLLQMNEVHAALLSTAKVPEYNQDGSDVWDLFTKSPTGTFGETSKQEEGESVRVTQHEEQSNMHQPRQLLLVSDNTLESFYNSTNGASWTTNTNWLVGSACPSGNWYGVTCSSDVVVSLMLTDNNVQGTIPSQIGSLSEMTNLALASNQLSNKMPSEIGLLTALTTLLMKQNSFSGAIPSQLGQLTDFISEFSFIQNRLNGTLPSELGQLSKITAKFDIYSNSFSGHLPSQLGQLSILTTSFRVNSNSFTGAFPSQIGQLSLLVSYFVADSNSFSGFLPSELGQFTDLLSSFSINANRFSGRLPSEIGQLESIATTFDIFRNSFTGSIPSELGRLSQFVYNFYLRWNRFSGSIPSQLGRLSKLTARFFVDSNQLTGSIPSQLGLLSQMKNNFALNSNNLDQSIPSELGQLTLMTSAFYLNSNDLCAQVPSQVSALSALVTSGWNIVDANSLGTPCVTSQPTSPPTTTSVPTVVPTRMTFVPTSAPTISQSPTLVPSSPTSTPTPPPTMPPSLHPTPTPTSVPTSPPTSSPSLGPTTIPTPIPSLVPSLAPTNTPTSAPTVRCESGTYLAGFTCVECSIGYYSNFEGVPFPTACTFCPGGQYNIAAGSAACLNCAVGKLSSPDRTYCQDCEAGQYNYNDTECVECEYGKYAPQALTDSCLECDAGFHTNAASEATSCTACDAGTFSHGASLNCSSCDQGKFSSGGAVNCSECAVGFVATSIRSSLCSACSAGRYAVSSSNCSSCPAGQFQGSTGQALCNQCDMGTYSSGKGGVVCNTCSLAFTSSTGSAKCSLADEGYYLIYDDNEDVLSSESCPGHTTCIGFDYAPIPDNGYWVDRSSYVHASDIYPCPRETCKGVLSNITCWQYRSSSNHSLDWGGSCTATELMCSEGAFGHLCGSCEVGFVYRGETKTCKRCEGVLQFAYTLLAVACVVFILVVALGVAFQKGLISFSSNYLTCIDSGSLKVLWVTYQIIVSVSWNLDVKFPLVFSQMLSLLSALSLDILSLECFQSQSEDRYFITVYLWCSLPILVAFVIVVMGAIRYLTAHHEDKLTMLNQHAWLLLLWSYLVLPPVTMKQLQGLDCIPFKHDDSSYLRVDTSVNCRSDEYKVFRTIDMMFFCVYQLIPLAWMLLLYRNRQALHVPQNSKNEELSLNERNANPSLSYLRFLFKDYKGDKWWFEVAEMYRRIMFVGVLPLFTPNTSKRASLGCIFAIISFVYFREEEPFREMFTNSIACIAQMTILLTFYTALSIDSGVVIDFGLGDLGIGVFLIMVNLIVFGLVVRLGYARFTKVKVEQQWRRVLTTQELDIVEKVMIGQSIPRFSNDKGVDDVEEDIELKSKAQLQHRDDVTSDIVKQNLLVPKDVVMTKRVGAGAFGEVFKGTCMGETVAIKTMIDVTEPNVREFKAEIVLTATLRHPNIVNFVGACWCKELMCLVLEWVAKGSLRDLLETKDLRWDDPLLRLACDVARGMNYLHNRKYYDEREGEIVSCILHRDLKPDNALVSEYIAAKLADFGTSRAKGEEDVTMTAVGTPLYVAPEIARGELYDEKVDVYSFGLTLMEMCLEEPLLEFIGARWVIAFDKKKIPKQPMRLIRPMTEDGWRPVTDENPISFAPPTINSLIVRCCSHDPTKRPSFEVILEELNGKCKEEIDAGHYGRLLTPLSDEGIIDNSQFDDIKGPSSELMGEQPHLVGTVI